MRITEFTNIKESDAKKMVEVLNKYLANLHVHYSNLRVHHWHVTGRHFFGIHERTEELYDQAFEQIDEVAERVLMLDGVPVRKFDDVLKLSEVKEVEHTDCAKSIAQYILDATKVLTRIEREILELADKTDDIATDDLITGYLAEREKTAWMYAAFLDPKKA